MQISTRVAFLLLVAFFFADAANAQWATFSVLKPKPSTSGTSSVSSSNSSTAPKKGA